MATPPPEDIPVWATSASSPADIDQPPASTIASGWPALLPPPHEWVNWWWNLVGQWLAFLSATSRVYSTLADAVEWMDASGTYGDLVTVFRDDNDDGPGVFQGAVATGTMAGTHFGAVDACGGLVVVCFGAGTARAYDPEFAGVVATYTPTNSGNMITIKTNGTVTLLAYGEYLECYNALTGASLWVWHADASVTDVCLCAGAVYVAHARSGAAGDATVDRHLHKLDVTTGASDGWSFQHASAGGTLYSVCTNGREVFVAGTASDFASGADVRAIVAANGKDATGECNNGEDLTGLAWDLVDGSSLDEGTLDCDGVFLYMGRPFGAATQLVTMAQADGSTVWSYAHPDAATDCVWVSCDPDYVYGCFDRATHAQGELIAFDKRTGAPAWRYGLVSGSVTLGHVSAVSDGEQVFALGSNADQFLRRLSRGNVPQRYRYVDPATELVRYRNWKLQPEAQ